MTVQPFEIGSDPFDVVVISLPGYGFSDRPRHRGMDLIRIAEIVVPHANGSNGGTTSSTGPTSLEAAISSNGKSPISSPTTYVPSSTPTRHNTRRSTSNPAHPGQLMIEQLPSAVPGISGIDAGPCRERCIVINDFF
jgi:hypothetical protein